MQLNFDARTVPPAQPLDPIPDDWYGASMVSSEHKPTKDGTGSYLETVYKVSAGPYAGRMIFDRMNLQNASAQAVEIAYRTLSAICHATGMLVIQDSSQLHGKPLEVKVALIPAVGEYQPKNEVKGYRVPGSGQKPAGNGAGSPPAPAVAPAVAGAPPPWTQPLPAAAPAAIPVAGAPPPWAQPAAVAPIAPVAPVAPPPPVAPVAQFPPAGWLAHPAAPGYFYKGQEVQSEAQLRAAMAPVAPVAPAFAPPAFSPPALPAVPGPAAAAGGAVPPWAK